MERGIFISDIASRFERYSKELYSQKGVLVLLARIRGERWDFVAGMQEKKKDLLVSSRREFSDGLGVLIYSGSSLPEKEEEKIFRDVEHFLFPGFPRGGIAENPTEEEVLRFLKTSDEDLINQLFEKADEVRKKYVGDEVHIRGLIEASNICDKDCFYCGLRKGNKDLERYKMTCEEIFSSARFAHDSGYGTVVIQSGESLMYTVDELCRLIERIKRSFGLAVSLSLGEMRKDQYAALRSAGADRYLMRFETSDKTLFSRLKPGSRLEDRLERISWLSELGYQVGSGIMIGIPGQTPESVARDIMLFGELDLDMVGSGPFIPGDNTPLAGTSGGDLISSLKLIALTRLVTLNAHIPATTALGSIDISGREKGLKCGANVIMPNCTPGKYRKNYVLYPGKICIDEDATDCASCIKAMVLYCGRKASNGPGHSLKNSKEG